jgi:hypothetical protein
MPMSPRLLRPLASGFDPRKIANLAVWLDFSDTSTLFQNSDGTTPATAASDPVGYVADKSGAGRNATQSTANNRPTITSSTFNGKRGLAFDGSNDSLTLGNISAAFPNSQGMAFIVFNVPSADNLYMIMRTRTNFSNTWQTTNRQTFEGAWRTTRLGQTIISAANYSVVPTPAVFTLRSSTSLYDWSFNETVEATGSADWNAGDSYSLAGSTSDSYMLGNMFEVLLYSRVLSAAEEQTVRRALYKKWGITP